MLQKRCLPVHVLLLLSLLHTPVRIRTVEVASPAVILPTGISDLTNSRQREEEQHKKISEEEFYRVLPANKADQ